jgi:hypothetical protein
MSYTMRDLKFCRVGIITVGRGVRLLGKRSVRDTKEGREVRLW